MFGPSPNSQDICVTASANAGGYTTDPTVNNGPVSASDGLGDASTGNGITGSGLTGSHLFHLDNSQLATVLTLPAITLTASALSTGGTYCTVSLQAAKDTREVLITCPTVDSSQYRDPPLTGPVIVNSRGGNEALRGDTVRPYAQPIGGTGYLSLGYHANVAGIWGSNSSYLWNSQSGGPNPGDFTESGMFTLGINGVPDHTPAYKSTYWDLGGASNFVDHIYLHLTDSSGGANATSNYYMHFHEKYEPVSWPEDASYPRKQTTQVDPDVPSWPTYSYHAEVNPDTNIIDSLVGPASAASTFSYGGTEAESWHLDGGLGIPVEPVDLHFGGGYDQDILNKFSGSNIAVPVALLPGQKTWAVYRQDIKRHKGHLDTYGTHGYLSTGVWYRDENVGIEHGIYYPYANATTDNAHDPDPNWLPGY